MIFLPVFDPFYMFIPLKTFGGTPSSSIISSTLLFAFGSVKLATQTSATKSLEISPLLDTTEEEREMDHIRNVMYHKGIRKIGQQCCYLPV